MDFKAKGVLKILKKSSKQEIELQPCQIFKTIRSMYYFKLGMGNSAESFQSKFIVCRYLNILVSRDKDTSVFLQTVLVDIDLCGKLNSFANPSVYKERL